LQRSQLSSTTLNGEESCVKILQGRSTKEAIPAWAWLFNSVLVGEGVQPFIAPTASRVPGQVVYEDASRLEFYTLKTPQASRYYPIPKALESARKLEEFTKATTQMWHDSIILQYKATAATLDNRTDFSPQERAQAKQWIAARIADYHESVMVLNTFTRKMELASWRHQRLVADNAITPSQIATKLVVEMAPSSISNVTELILAETGLPPRSRMEMRRADPARGILHHRISEADHHWKALAIQGEPALYSRPRRSWTLAGSWTLLIVSNPRSQRRWG
jgi:hypothetical protein